MSRILGVLVCLMILSASAARAARSATAPVEFPGEAAEVRVDAVRGGPYLFVATSAGNVLRLPEEGERAEVISGLKSVDLVTIFDDPTVEGVIRAVRPDFHAKGTDYTAESVPEREIVSECGGRVVIVGDPKDHSSTELIGSVRRSSME